MQDVHIIGLDIAKNSFHAHAAAVDGTALFSKALPRGRVLNVLGKLQPCIVALEACAGAHHWGREITALGHEVRLIPPQYPPNLGDRPRNIFSLLDVAQKMSAPDQDVVGCLWIWVVFASPNLALMEITHSPSPTQAFLWWRSPPVPSDSKTGLGISALGNPKLLRATSSM